MWGGSGAVYIASSHFNTEGIILNSSRINAPIVTWCHLQYTGFLLKREKEQLYLYSKGDARRHVISKKMERKEGGCAIRKYFPIQEKNMGYSLRNYSSEI